MLTFRPEAIDTEEQLLSEFMFKGPDTVASFPVVTTRTGQDLIDSIKCGSVQVSDRAWEEIVRAHWTPSEIRQQA